MGLKPRLFSRQSVTTNVSFPLNMEISSVNHKPVVKALLSHGRKMDNWAQPIDNIKKLRASAANEFLLGVMLDNDCGLFVWCAALLLAYLPPNLFAVLFLFSLTLS